jgi:hypothetical protein
VRQQEQQQQEETNSSKDSVRGKASKQESFSQTGCVMCSLQTSSGLPHHSEPCKQLISPRIASCGRTHLGSRASPQLLGKQSKEKTSPARVFFLGPNSREDSQQRETGDKRQEWEERERQRTYCEEDCVSDRNQIRVQSLSVVGLRSSKPLSLS